MSLNGNLSIGISADLTKTINALQSGKSPAALSRNWTIKNGSAANEANAMYAFTLALADGANDTIDIVAGISDAYGDSITFLNIKAWMIANVPDTGGTGKLLVGGAAANPWETWSTVAGSKFTLAPNGENLMVDRTVGYAATGGSADTVKFEHDGTGSIGLTVHGVFVGVI